MTHKLVKTWTKRVNDALAGRTIRAARYMTREEAERLGWTNLVPVLELDNGTLLCPSMDDEGNNGGALFGQVDGEELVFPVINTYSLR